MAYEAGLPSPGTVVGGYVVRRQVGQGGMAAVFEATHVSLGKRVALKMLLPHHATRSNIAKRFVREGEAAARLNHPHAVDVTDVGTDARGAPYLVMEFLEGEDLASLLDRKQRLSLAEVADIMVPVISAIAAAHELGIVHRDLKPNNIFIARRGHSLVPKVVDFGISKVDTESMKLTGTQAILGTPHYMSPEQAQGSAQLDARSDQFSLGVILYECIVGKRPFESDSVWGVITQIIHQVPTPPSKLAVGVSSRFEAIIERALQKQVKDRYPDVRKLGAALIEFASTRTRLSHGADFGLSIDSMEISRPGRESAPSSRHEQLAHASAATVDEAPHAYSQSVEVTPRRSRAPWLI
ncbi:MAG TPA: serine/threonine-protein kinase, partial [Polyangiales bacterium]|nr:serine/threonine-protein kinase [Polyangiales bacterium]